MRISFMWLPLSLALLSILCTDIAAAGSAIQATYGLSQQPLAFTKNCGQWNDQALFRAVDGPAELWFTHDATYFQFTRRRSETIAAPLNDSYPGTRPGDATTEMEYLSFGTRFTGMDQHSSIIEEGMLDYRCSYFLGDDSTQWRTNVPNFSAIVRKGIYPGIDVRYYANESGQLEHDFIVSPGADYSQIQMRFDAVDKLAAGEDGSLLINTAWGQLIESVPRVYQEVQGTRRYLSGEFELADSQSVRFIVGDNYDRTLALVIDPILIYSTYLGGSSDEQNPAIEVDSAGSVYVTGSTLSANFPTMPFQSKPGDLDAFVTKFSIGGNALVYSVFVGGSFRDRSYGIALSPNGSVIITGGTESSNFPTQNAIQTFQGSEDIFVTRINASGSSLNFSTYLGGIGYESGTDVALSSEGKRIFVTGSTGSSDLATPNAYQQTLQSNVDAFVVCLSPNAPVPIVYITYLGGSSTDFGNGIDTDGNDNAFVVGTTYSSDFPTFPAIESFHGVQDAFITKFNSDGSSVIYSHYLGGSDIDQGTAVVVNGSGQSFVAGVTTSTDYPAAFYSHFQTNQGGQDLFVTKLSGSGSSIMYSTYIGGSGDDGIYGPISLDVDLYGQAFVTGMTASSDFPLLNPYQTYQGAGDVCVAKLNSSGTALRFSTYIGGTRSDYGYDIAADAFGYVYVTGVTNSGNFPTVNPYQATYQGPDHEDAFVAKLRGFLCGDGNNDGNVNISDAVYIVTYIFGGGPAPIPVAAADVDCSGAVNISDAVYLINYIFSGGPAPCAAC